MQETPPLKMEFDPSHGREVKLAPLVSRVTAKNPSPFTFHGTNTYLVGGKSLAVIDPGPDDSDHFQALLNAIGNRKVSHIFVTHTHSDHSPLSRRLAESTGAKILGEGPHRLSRELNPGEGKALDVPADWSFAPDVKLVHGERVEAEEWTLEAIHAPGHAANHMAFALKGTDFLFSGDHVMGWSTTIVAPPDGSMSQYMNSLRLCLERPESVYFPGHGGAVERAHDFVRALLSHRRSRAKAILNRIRAGDRTIPEIVSSVYRGIDERLRFAASLSTLAHLEELNETGRILCEGHPNLTSIFSAAEAEADESLGEGESA